MLYIFSLHSIAELSTQQSIEHNLTAVNNSIQNEIFWFTTINYEGSGSKQEQHDRK